MDCTYVNNIIAKYDNNGQLTQNERTAYSNLSQALNNWFYATYNKFSYYPKLTIQQSGSRAKGTAIKGKSDMDMFLSIDDPNNANTLKQYYDSIFDFLKRKNYIVRKQNVSIGVKYYGCDIDVVPAKKVNSMSYQRYNDHYLWSNKHQNRMLTNIQKHIDKTDCLFNLVKCKSSTLQENEVKMSDDGQYNVFGASGIIATTENYQFDESAILVLKDGSKAGKIQYASGMYSVVGTSVILIPNDSRDTRYIYFAMMAIDFEKYKVGSGIPHIYFKDYSAEKIYYPDAKQRERIAKTLDTYETKINIEKGMLSALQKQKAFLLQSMFI